MQRATLELVCDLDAADGEAAACARFQRYAQSAGFDSVACVVLPVAGELTPDCVLMNTRPAAWTAEYVRRRLARFDPVLREVSRRSTAFQWSDIWRERALTAEERAVMSYSAEFGLRDGFVVPIFAYGSVALVSLAGEGLNLHVRERQALTLASVYLHNRLSALRRRRQDAVVRLTEREREVMRWAAAGKSDWQIGRILNISPKTANFHVENVKRKFGVVSRVQAIIGALVPGARALSGHPIHQIRSRRQ
ncbi:MAG TPA: LuxR family transcriptional regulator [Hyphomicrobiaceae bacterium]|nr:LuxR family transcriptional regulator [Hyphomicrobiaceae bacterium]